MIHIMSSTKDVFRGEVINRFENQVKLLDPAKFRTFKFPEVKDGYPVHERKLYEDFKSLSIECIKSGIQLYILTYSSNVFNGVRAACKELGDSNSEACAYVYNIKPDGSTSLAHINSNGRLDKWDDGVFDTWDVAIEEIV